MSRCRVWGLVTLLTLTASTPADGPAAERGKQALLGRNFVPPSLSVQAYDTVWKQWGLGEKPADHDQQLHQGDGGAVLGGTTYWEFNSHGSIVNCPFSGCPRNSESPLCYVFSS